VFDYLIGNVKDVREKSITLMVGGIGFALSMPNTKSIIKGSSSEFYTYFHWSADNGPTLYGFSSELDRQVFLMIIDCPKIGPSIALNILSNMHAAQFLELITLQNEKGLSAINGIGSKKAEQIIVHLKHKVQKFISTGAYVIEQQESFVHWQNVSDVLSSLNYSKQEISKAMNYLSEKSTGQNLALDQLIRSALSFLSSKQ